MSTKPDHSLDPLPGPALSELGPLQLGPVGVTARLPLPRYASPPPALFPRPAALSDCLFVGVAVEKRFELEGGITREPQGQHEALALRHACHTVQIFCP